MFTNALQENEEWQPYNYSLDIEPNSIMDMSDLVPKKIAGDDGWITVDSKGNFVLENIPNQRLRLYGVNVCFGAVFPKTHEDSDRFCDNLLRRGYNSIRIHHYDAGLVGDDFKGANFKNSYTFNEEHLEQFDYLFAGLKKRGIYVTIDLYTYRPFKKDEIPEYGKELRMEIKVLVPLYDSAINAWSRFAVNLFEHTNPYTGLAYKDDPALFSLCLLNEDTLLHLYAIYPDIKKIYEQRFQEWIKEKYPESSSDDNSLLCSFLSELQVKANIKMTNILRDIGVKSLITGANYWDLVATTAIRKEFDYIDTHVYWDHPEFMVEKGKLPYDHHQQMDTERSSLTLRTVNTSRMYDKPFMMTEFNDVYPNHYRAEGGTLFGAYMSLQDWDGAFRFDFSNSRESALDPTRSQSWAISSDPIGMLNDKIITFLFARGDVAPAENSYAYLIDENEVFSSNCMDNYALGSFPISLGFIGLLSKVGYVFKNSKNLENYKMLINRYAKPQDIPDNLNVHIVPEQDASSALKENAPTPSFTYTIDESVVDQDLFKEIGETHNFNPIVGEIVSDTGEITIDAKRKTLKVITGKTESFVLPGNVELEGDAVKVMSDNFCTVTIASVDKENIQNSKRLMVLHLSDVQMTNTEYSDKTHCRITSLGKLPHLVRASEAVIKIKHDAFDSIQIWSVESSGKRIEKIPVKVADNIIIFKAKTVGYSVTTMSYEIIIK